MQIVVLLGDSAFDNALMAARRVGTEELAASGALRAPFGAALKGQAADVWDRIERALRAAHDRGVQIARPLIDEASKALDSAIAAAGALAGEMKAFIAEKLRRFVDTLIDRALTQLKTTIRVGTVELKIAKVGIVQKIKLTGDLKASLEELCALSANGEMSVEAEYAV
jgi:hypothetical protein